MEELDVFLLGERVGELQRSVEKFRPYLCYKV